MMSELARASEMLTSCSSAEEYYLKCAVSRANPHEMFKSVADKAKATYSDGLADDIDHLTIEEYFREIKSGNVLSAARSVQAYAEKIVFLDMLCEGAVQLFSSPAFFSSPTSYHIILARQ